MWNRIVVIMEQLFYMLNSLQNKRIKGNYSIFMTCKIYTITTRFFLNNILKETIKKEESNHQLYNFLEILRHSLISTFPNHRTSNKVKFTTIIHKLALTLKIYKTNSISQIKQKRLFSRHGIEIYLSWFAYLAFIVCNWIRKYHTTYPLNIITYNS